MSSPTLQLLTAHVDNKSNIYKSQKFYSFTLRTQATFLGVVTS